MTTNRALVMDVDGVVAPVHGKTAWGDDVVAGTLFGPVLVSPTLCARLDEIAAAVDLAGVWLTDWFPETRARMDPFPGRDWATIERPVATSTARTWTKWPALQAWLDDHPDQDPGVVRQPPDPLTAHHDPPTGPGARSTGPADRSSNIGRADATAPGQGRGHAGRLRPPPPGTAVAPGVPVLNPTALGAEFGPLGT